MENGKVRVEFSVLVDIDGKCRLWAYRFSNGDSGEFVTGSLNRPQKYVIEADLDIPTEPAPIKVKAETK